MTLGAKFLFSSALCILRHSSWCGRQFLAAPPSTKEGVWSKGHLAGGAQLGTPASYCGMPRDPGEQSM